MNNLLDSFGGSLNIAIIGASGGIGKAFIEYFVAQDNVDKIYAFSRSKLNFDHNRVVSNDIDITDETSIANASNLISDVKLDIIIIATGLLHGDNISPEKSLNDLDMNKFQEIFAINTFGPALIAKHFLPLIKKDSKSIFAALSARVGSISDNRLGGWYAYRASKSALNMIIKNTAIEIARKNKQACIIGLHPGTVKTGLSKPFQSNVSSEKLFTPEYSAEKLINVINNVTQQDSGKIFAWDGQEIEA